MKVIFCLVFSLLIIACDVKVEVVRKYHQYFDDSTWALLQEGINAYQHEQYVQADSMLTSVINTSKDKLSINMPQEFNPYYYRASNNMELDRYEQAISDLDRVASDTTTNTHVLLIRTEAFKMLKMYDTTIILCNRLLSLKYDSVVALSQRGLCYYQKGDIAKACIDFNYCKKYRKDTFLNRFMKDCK